MNVDRNPEAWATARWNLLEWLEAGELKITISRRLPLAEAAEAHRRLENRGSVGKIVLLPGAG
jgi:NADPH:quinone reductase